VAAPDDQDKGLLNPLETLYPFLGARKARHLTKPSP
jgi:hypothetical protein